MDFASCLHRLSPLQSLLESLIINELLNDIGHGFLTKVNPDGQNHSGRESGCNPRISPNFPG